MTAGAIPVSSLNGTEQVVVDNGGAVVVTATTQQIANLAASGTTPYLNTATLATTNPATQREIYGKINLTYAGNVTIGGGMGSVAGVRGEVAGAAGTTLKDGFYYGAQGKFTLGGATIQETSAARYCGVIAQLDVSAGTMTSGQLSALWADMGASAAGAFAAETNVVRATNTTAQAVNAIVYGYGKATYGFDLSDNSGGWLKVNINGSTRYIPLTDSVS